MKLKIGACLVIAFADFSVVSCNGNDANLYSVSDISHYYVDDSESQAISSEIASEEFFESVRQAFNLTDKPAISFRSLPVVSRDEKLGLSTLGYSLEIGVEKADQISEKRVVDLVTRYVKSRLIGFSKNYSETHVFAASKEGIGRLERAIAERYNHVDASRLEKAGSRTKEEIFLLSEGDVQWTYVVHLDESGSVDLIQELRGNFSN